tara:strand:- start:4785 stop:5042 length:258 start_codon:yes stop_codon:yes gene_type:complete
MDIYNQTWIGRELTVLASTDSTLVDRRGCVVDETRNTLALQEGDRKVILNKASITFTVDNHPVVIEGAMVGHRPEDRIHRTYRKA